MKNQLQQHRDLLDNILDLLIPANAQKGIPAAGTAQVGDFLESRAAQDESVLVALNQLLSHAAQLNTDVNVEMVEAIEAGNTEHFTLLLTLTYMGYYSRPEIRSTVGVGSWPVHPKGYEVPLEPTDMIKKLTAPVSERGAMYRNPNDELQASSNE